MTTPELLRSRTQDFALAVIRFCRTLPSNNEGWVIGKQLLRCGTSVAANYRATNRARSHAEFIAKLGIVVEEADETVFWLELLKRAGTVVDGDLQALMAEARELLAIFAASQKTAKARQALASSASG
jgi:four helix bundle protein